MKIKLNLCGQWMNSRLFISHLLRHYLLLFMCNGILSCISFCCVFLFIHFLVLCTDFY
uniref:Uncharacterized protein n=1 Tax=Rhizophora mucronata TaxID=61149 RepID=A0A2P2QW55_RHIMU